MKKTIRRNYITMLEVLIAMSLMSILIIAVLGFYSQLESIHQEIAKQRKKTFYALYVQNRLSNTIPFAHGSKDHPWFYTTTEGDHPSLVFVYNNGIDGDPLFSYLILGKLYIDTKNRLILASWPLPKGDFSDFPPMRKEVLQEGIERLSFSFYKPPSKNTAELKIGQTDSEEELDHWSIDQESIPPIVKITIKTTDQASTTMAFVMLHTFQPVLY